MGSSRRANQVAEFCGEVQVVTVLGEEDSHEEYIRSSLHQNVSLTVFARDDAPTVVKRRYLFADVERKMFEISHVGDEATPGRIEEAMVECIGEQAPRHDLVMITDYGHGALTQRIAAEATSKARFAAANAQTNSANMGYNLITKKYLGLDYACVDEAEARLAIQERHEDIRTVGLKLLRRLDAERLMITRGSRGSVMFDGDGSVYEAPALATQVVDRVGAGDAFFAVTAPGAAKGMPPDLVSLAGNAVGALAVEIVGNREPVPASRLHDFIASLVT